MVKDRTRALAHARRSVAPSGSPWSHVVDFGDFAGMPPPLGDAFRAYLRAFHVEPLEGDVLAGAVSVGRGPARYYVVATFSALPG